MRSAGGLSVGRGLTEAMVRVAPQVKYCFVVPDGVGYELKSSSGTPQVTVHHVREMGVANRVIFDTIRLPAIVDSFKPSAVLALDSGHALRRPPWPQAVLVQAAHLVYPTKHFGRRTLKNRLRHSLLKWHFRRSLRHTRLVLAPTQVMADRVKRLYDFKGRVFVCGTSLPPSLFHSGIGRPAIPDVYRAFPRSFKLLYTTRYYPHKNVERIVDLFVRYPEELTDVVVFLTISPDHHPNVRRILRRIRRRGLERNIVCLGHVPQNLLGAYYVHSDGLLMPSTLETFSTTYVEAMAAGLPILTSDLDFAHEACGDAALYFDPWVTEDILNAIIRLRDDVDLRRSLVANARGRTNTMQSWDDIAFGIVRELTTIV